MFTVALIGGDGAGKTTVARRLETSFPIPVKTLYMGVSMESTNIALPTSRQFERWRRQLSQQRSAVARPRKKSFIWMWLRLLNRIAEEWFRQWVAWRFRASGTIIVFDRHFLFDFELQSKCGQHVTDRVHRWLLAKFYPRPDVTIFLDAPPEILHARKHEGTLDWLESRRAAFLEQGRQTLNFFRVDATATADAVYREVSWIMLNFHRASVAGIEPRCPVRGRI